MADFNINLTLQNILSVCRFMLDIGIMWLIIYICLKYIKTSSRTIQIFKGIIAVVVLNLFAKILGLTTIESLSNIIISWGFLAMIIIFQPELRRLLENIGKSNSLTKISSLLPNEKEYLVEQVYEGAVALAKAKVGALITIEQNQSLNDYIKTGKAIDGIITKELICSIFMTTTPLHDGAIIIQGNKVACASTYFPPTSVNLSSRYGARHRAALGIAEISDALTIVVSEETSAISIAKDGSIFNVNNLQLKEYLKKIICNEEILVSESSTNMNNLANDNGGDTKFYIIDDEIDMKVPYNNRDKVINHQGFSEKEEKIEIIDNLKDK